MAHVPACAQASSRKIPGDFIFYTWVPFEYSYCYEHGAETYVRTAASNAAETEERPPEVGSVVQVMSEPPRASESEIAATARSYILATTGQEVGQVSLVDTTLESAMTAMKGAYPKESSNATIRSWLGGEAVIVQAKGSFTDDAASTPGGAKGHVSGSTITVAIGAHDLNVLAVSVSTESQAPQLATVGTVRTSD